MSIKHRVKDRAEDGKIRALWMINPGEYTRDPWYKKREYVDFGKNPAWWNRQYNNRPKRKEARALCRDIVRGDRDPEAAIFPHGTKPCAYYW